MLSNAGTSSTVTSAGTLTTNVHLNPAGLPHAFADVTQANFTLATANTFIVGIGATKPASSTFAITGNIYGDSDVVLGSNDEAGDGAGRLLLAGSNSYTGTTLIAGGGIVALGSTAALPPSTNVVFNFPFSQSSAPILDLNGYSQTINSLDSLPTGPNTKFAITNSGSLGATLTISGTTTPYYPYTGQINNGLSPLAIAKGGNSTLMLTDSNTYSGGTTISGGIIEISNTGATGTGMVTVASGGALASSSSGGTITGPVTVQNGGSLLPGNANSLGTLTITGTGLTLQNGSSATLGLAVGSPVPVTGSGFLTLPGSGASDHDQYQPARHLVGAYAPVRLQQRNQQLFAEHFPNRIGHGRRPYLRLRNRSRQSRSNRLDHQRPGPHVQRSRGRRPAATGTRPLPTGRAETPIRTTIKTATMQFSAISPPTRSSPSRVRELLPVR